MPPALDDRPTKPPPSVLTDAHAARHAHAAGLQQALHASRQDTLRTFADFEHALPQLRVPQHDTLNPPLWELGHLGWFQDHWTTRNPQRALGIQADPLVPRRAAARADIANADALYNSSTVPHHTRWALPLPNADSTRSDLARQLQNCLGLLDDTPGDDRSLYFHRLVLFHEDMHHEAALHAAQSLDLKINDPRWQARALPKPCQQLTFETIHFQMGHTGGGFAFDNELTAHRLQLPPVQMDSQVLRWAEYLPFVEDGGYKQPQWWTEAGRNWLAAEQPKCPRYTRRDDADAWVWQHQIYGQWQPLDLHLPACHLTAFEAEAWCRWAGRRLPTEAEWERAAVQCAGDFSWGQVWEWTASDFAPYPGFVAHPYRDYSAPWFGQRQVLRGGSFMTQPRMRHPRYRNFFMPQRNDVPAGFRSCAL
jgi:gamma-glutamyl hercynylcysteine S-oxide synthase